MTKRQNSIASLSEVANKGDDDESGSAMLETKMLEATMLEATMLETKIENQPSTISQGRIQRRSTVKRKAGKTVNKFSGSTPSIMALPSRPVKPCVITNDKDHSRLAMQAAKRMKSSKDKLRTGRLVCLHLKSLLASTQYPDTMPHLAGATPSVENRQYPLPM